MRLIFDEMGLSICYILWGTLTVTIFSAILMQV